MLIVNVAVLKDTYFKYKDLNSNWMNKLTIYLSYFIVVIGLLSVTGKLLDSQIIFGVGIATAASPYPTPMTGDKYYENFADERKYILTFYNSSVQEIVQDKVSVSKFLFKDDKKLMDLGPHSRKIVYYNGLGPDPNLERKNVQKTILYYLFCSKRGPIKQNGIFDNPIKNVELEISYTKNNYSRIWRYNAHC